jgi:two-component system, response regulator PdtaR
LLLCAKFDGGGSEISPAFATRSEGGFGVTEAQPKGRVLIVEDQFLASEYLKIWSEAYAFEVCAVATTADAAVALAKQHRPTHILMDVRLDGARDGVDAAIEIHEAIATRIIYCTGSSEPSMVKRIQMDHPFEILFKPIDPKLLGEALLRQ